MYWAAPLIPLDPTLIHQRLYKLSFSNWKPQLMLIFLSTLKVHQFKLEKSFKRILRGERSLKQIVSLVLQTENILTEIIVHHEFQYIPVKMMVVP